MKQQLLQIAKAALLGALIGAIAAIAISEFTPQSASGGAVIGAVVGSIFAIRIALRRQLPPEAAR